MCAIIGYYNFPKSSDLTINSLKKVSYRGIEGAGIYDGSDIITKDSINELPATDSTSSMGHLLHSMVGFLRQPICSEGVLVSNCEIYNWKELAKKYDFKVQNDSELLLRLLDKKEILEMLEELDGTFAFAYEKDSKLILARDILGVKPLWYFFDGRRFAFASEKKALGELKDVKELNPREIIIYDFKTNNLSIIRRELELPEEEKELDYETIKEKTKGLLFEAIRKRVPQGHKIGLLFSGGIDSTFIALALKELGVEFICYSANLSGGNIEEAEDIIYSKEIAKRYGLRLNINTIEIKELEEYAKEVMDLIEDSDYVKVSVALPLYVSSQFAKKDNVKVLFSGLGSEEIFAGYKRHKKADDINLECYKGLLTLHQRDLYRDDLVTMKNNIELRVPFLDKKLIDFSLRVPSCFKYDPAVDRNKIVLRDIAKEMGLDERYSERRKKAAQYGSKFDKGILRLAKNVDLSKQEYLNSLNPK